MLSIRRFLDQPSRSEPASRVLPLILEAIWLHAIEFNPISKRLFQKSIRELEVSLENAESVDEALVRAGELIREFQRYTSEAEQYLVTQGKELHNMVTMLTGTVVDLCGSAAKSARNLQEIGHSLENAKELKDLHLLRSRMAEDLTALRADIESQREQYETIKNTLRQSEQKTAKFSASMSADPITGLEDRHTAARAIGELCEADTTFHVAVFQIDNLEGANNRYGFETGDGMLFVFSQHLAQNLPVDRIFRWRGPSFVAIVERNLSYERARMEIQKLSSSRLEHTLQSGSREIMFPISWSWTLMRVDRHSEATAIIEKIDRFVTEKAQDNPEVATRRA